MILDFIKEYWKQVIIVCLIIVGVILGFSFGKSREEIKIKEAIIEQREGEIKNLTKVIENSMKVADKKIDSIGIYQIISARETKKRQVIRRKITNIQHETDKKIAAIDSLPPDSLASILPGLAERYKRIKRRHN